MKYDLLHYYTNLKRFCGGKISIKTVLLLLLWGNLGPSKGCCFFEWLCSSCLQGRKVILYEIDPEEGIPKIGINQYQQVEGSERESSPGLSAYDTPEEDDPFAHHPFYYSNESKAGKKNLF